MPDSIPQSVPAAPQQLPSAIDELIKNISAPLPYTAMPRQIQMPTSLMRPVQPYTPQQIDQRQMVGRKAARGQGIANTIRTAGNVIGEAETKFKQQQQDKVRDAAQKVISAQQAIDEATQAHDAALASGDAAGASKAQQLIQQNTQARDAVFADPKMRKQLVKGFDISYVDPSSNKTPEHAAVMEAMKNAKTMAEKKAAYQQQQALQQQATQGAASAFAKATAQGVDVNPAAIEAQKANVAATKALIPLLSAQVRANSAESLETRREAHTDNLALMKSQDSWDRLNANISARRDLENTQFGHKFREISAEGSKELAVFKAKLVEKNADPLTSVKAYQDFQTKSATTQSKLAEAVSTLQVQRDQAAKQKPYNESMVSNLDQQLSVAKQAQTTYGQAIDGISTWYKKRAGVSEEDKPSGSKSSSSSLSSASTYLSDTAADPDEGDENY